MQPTFLNLIVSCFAYIHLATMTPILDFSLESRQAINCTDVAAPFNEACWGTLKVGDWLNNPTTGWNKTTPICTGSQDGAACCEPNEIWTTCFLRLAYGTSGRDCSEINPQYCSFSPDLSVHLDPKIVPQVRYVVENIYGTICDRKLSRKRSH